MNLSFFKTILIAIILGISVVIIATPNLLSTEGQVAGEQTSKGDELKIRGDRNLNVLDNNFSNPISFEGLNAESAMVFDLTSNQILGQKNPDLIMPIASLTKLMTGYLTVNYLDFQDNYELRNNPVSNTSPSLGLKKGDTIRIQDLYTAMLVGSANDSAFVLADAVADKLKVDPVQRMNEMAWSLGMKNTHYKDPAGLAPQNQSSISDLLLLVKKCLSYGEFNLIGKSTSVSFESVSGRKFSIRATNQLISKELNLYALKTGYTDEAKGSMISQMDINGKVLVIFVLGSTDREKDTMLVVERLKSLVK